MGAEDLGKKLLAEVEEAGLDEVSEKRTCCALLGRFADIKVDSEYSTI